VLRTARVGVIFGFEQVFPRLASNERDIMFEVKAALELVAIKHSY
jgi:hypothetical protein